MRCSHFLYIHLDMYKWIPHYISHFLVLLYIVTNNLLYPVTKDLYILCLFPILQKVVCWLQVGGGRNVPAGESEERHVLSVVTPLHSGAV